MILTLSRTSPTNSICTALPLYEDALKALLLFSLSRGETLRSLLYFNDVYNTELEWLLAQGYLDLFRSRAEIEQLRGPEDAFIIRLKQSEPGLAVSTLQPRKHYHLTRDKLSPPGQLLTHLTTTSEFRYIRKNGLIYPISWVKLMYQGHSHMRILPKIDEYLNILKSFHPSSSERTNLPVDNEDLKSSTARDWIDGLQDKGVNLRCLGVSLSPSILFASVLRFLKVDIPVSDLQHLILFHPLDLIGTLSCFAEMFQMTITVVEKAGYWYEIQEENPQKECLRPFLWGLVKVDNSKCDLFVPDEHYEAFKQEVFLCQRSL